MVVLPIRTDAGEKLPVSQPIEFLEPNYDEVQKLYAAYLLAQKAKKLIGSRQGQCVVFVRKFLETDEVASLAKNTEVNSKSPEPGAIIITNESKYGHVGAVLEYTDTTVTIAESNVPLGSEKMGIRILQLKDLRILGYRIIEKGGE